MKILIFFLLTLISLLTSCITPTYVNKKEIIKILPKDAVTWNLEECNEILDFYTTDNSPKNLFQKAPINQKVYIKVLLINKLTVKAMSRKEVIEKRLDEKDYYIILNNYLNDFTSLKYDESRNEIVEADPNFTNGYSFKIYFENISDPFTPIFLEDGYSYFFLENMKGDFSRVTNVTGLFVEDYFQLDGYLTAILNFSPFAENGKRIFEAKDLNESYKLVFNGLQLDPIVIQWNIK
ncbi:MAG: hypothetical protein KDC90_06255 [Ignavibacteriae bacterium]|nr:hypothetical protein [Ignavibacteriota bacterium]